MKTILLAAALLLAPLAGTGALATHMTQYAINPVEHDDQGRAHEPDFQASSAYAAGVRDCTIDVDGDGACSPADLAAWPADQWVAQGCTDDSGRQPSGLCSLLMCGPVGVCAEPLCTLHTMAHRTRFVDVRQEVYAYVPVLGPTVLDLNRKFADVGVPYLEEMLGLGSGDKVLGPAGILAWYGFFKDKNCNGVIDHSGSEQADPANEFTWVGACLPFQGTQRVVPEDVCIEEPTEFLGWEIPGNHHAMFNTGLGVCASVCLSAPADHPGSLVVCSLQARWSGGSSGQCDALEAEQNGDPLFGVQDLQSPDWYFYDYTGDPDVTLRTYVAAPNWPMYHYDQSLLVTSLFLGAVNPPRIGDAYDLAAARFLDVDVLHSVHPALEAYVTGLVKPTLRGTWLLVRDA